MAGDFPARKVSFCFCKQTGPCRNCSNILARNWSVIPTEIVVITAWLVIFLQEIVVFVFVNRLDLAEVVVLFLQKL